MKSLLVVPAAVIAVTVALTGCGAGDEYCVPTGGSNQACGAAARAWCDETSLHRSSLEASLSIDEAALQRLQSTDAACEHVGGP
jgi:hypothetical protein